MSRKPIDKQQPTECRQAIWDEARSLKVFSIRHMQVTLEWSSIREYLTALVKAGYLTRTDNSRAELIEYTLVKDCGAEAPRLRKDGTPVTQGAGRRQMWNSIQILKKFSANSLAFNASTEQHSVSEAEANFYCKALCQAGYLIRQGVNKYALVPGKWTGPQSPQIQKTRQVYDPNLKKVVWAQITGGAE